MPSEPAAERIGTGCGENQPRNPGKGEPGHAQSQGQENTAILGGSAGIGLATAALLPERGAEVTGWWDALPEADRRAAFTQFAGQTPVGRNGTAEDVAQAIAALIENDYITGVVLRRRAPAHLNRPDASPVAAGDAG